MGSLPGGPSDTHPYVSLESRRRVKEAIPVSANNYGQAALCSNFPRPSGEYLTLRLRRSLQRERNGLDDNFYM